MQIKKQLGQLDKWLGTAGEYAKAKNFDPNVLVGMRLAPDMFPLARQVQICCDAARRTEQREDACDNLSDDIGPAHCRI
jgi:hypothetical protein